MSFTTDSGRSFQRITILWENVLIRSQLRPTPRLIKLPAVASPMGFPSKRSNLFSGFLMDTLSAKQLSPY